MRTPCEATFHRKYVNVCGVQIKILKCVNREHPPTCFDFQSQKYAHFQSLERGVIVVVLQHTTGVTFLLYYMPLFNLLDAASHRHYHNCQNLA